MAHWMRCLGIALVMAACGGRTDLRQEVDASALDGPSPSPETCNGFDDDLDGQVDEDWRDEVGRYRTDEHCGACGFSCIADGAIVLASECQIIEESAVCAATLCADGMAPSFVGTCVPRFDHLCMSCLDDGDCGAAREARCADVAGEPRCTVACEAPADCPDGYNCMDSLCVPDGGSCHCGPGDRFDLACALEDPDGARCPGAQTCRDGTLSSCDAPDEVCDAADNDCDGTVDEGFVDARGAYILDIHHCGECGVDCTASTVPEGDLQCGGDPFAPTCVLECPDTLDGVQVGDRIDADRDIATGCECTLGSFDDEPGPVLAEGPALDPNCDGADGVVVESVYVAVGGNDGWPGSPTRPVRTLARAMTIARESLDTAAPRPNVFVASGSYTETLELPDGIRLYGGYRSDFLALDPDGFRVEVRTPVESTAPGGAALHIRGAGANLTRVRWMTFIGRDATGPGEAAFGAFLDSPGRNLELIDSRFIAGQPGAGADGLAGDRGADPTAIARAGEQPRGAIENGANLCTASMANVVQGGNGGINSCSGVTVNGGQGGSPSCPTFANEQPPGTRGQGAGAGNGGTGGQDSRGPISGPSCLTGGICCGLADFSVPTMFRGPQSGTRGTDGRAGVGGGGCADAFGRFEGDRWVPEGARNGSAGSAGSGGGGGGGGGGAEMEFVPGVCEFADGIGGGGGGGGAGGCGGLGGSGGTSGGPSVAVVVRSSGPLPTIQSVRVQPADGGRGGDGGSGGDGGRGGEGGLGGEVPFAMRSTPTLAGPFPGGRGGQGGVGGAGGGGGGGCGGASVGIWLTGTGASPSWQMGNTFSLGEGGRGGRGGGGGAPGNDGEEGGVTDVLVR